jgi:hypothetical protein
MNPTQEKAIALRIKFINECIKKAHGAIEVAKYNEQQTRVEHQKYLKLLEDEEASLCSLQIELDQLEL